MLRSIIFQHLMLLCVGTLTFKKGFTQLYFKVFFFIYRVNADTDVTHHSPGPDTFQELDVPVQHSRGLVDPICFNGGRVHERYAQIVGARVDRRLEVYYILVLLSSSSFVILYCVI